jgi:hypothetical protein
MWFNFLKDLKKEPKEEPTIGIINIVNNFIDELRKRNEKLEDIMGLNKTIIDQNNLDSIHRDNALQTRLQKIEFNSTILNWSIILTGIIFLVVIWTYSLKLQELKETNNLMLQNNEIIKDLIESKPSNKPIILPEKRK